MIDLTGRVALVTGGSRGIGRACALRLAQAGADITINYVVNRQAAMTVADEIAALGRRVLVVKADVSEQDDVRSMMDAIKEHFGRLDILLSNAATGGFRPLLAASARNFRVACQLELTRELASVLKLVGASGFEPPIPRSRTAAEHRSLRISCVLLRSLVLRDSQKLHSCPAKETQTKRKRWQAGTR